ncbi:hypothetical protein D3C74_394450 [compost metagenome]
MTIRSGPVALDTTGCEFPSMAMVSRFSLKLIPLTMVRFVVVSTGGTETLVPPSPELSPVLLVLSGISGVIRFTTLAVLSQVTFKPNCSPINRIGTNVVSLLSSGADVSTTVLSSTEAAV